MALPSQPPEHAVYKAANPDNDSAAVRAALRREKIAARIALPATENARLAATIESHLEPEFRSLSPGIVAFCWPIRGEFDARPLVGRLLACGWRAAMPTVIAVDAPMVFRPWLPGAVMAADPHGIPVPATALISPSPNVVLLPLVAFDSQGYRLGYGGGYFDRTLATLAARPLTIGIGFELAAVTDIGPQGHDIPLDAIVTEAGIRRFSRARRPP